MPSGFKFITNTLTYGINEEFPAKLDKAIMTLLNTEASKMLGEAKRNAPWTDRTGKARQSLGTNVKKEGMTKYVISLSHGVDYGLWLELCRDKRYAIILPTLESYGPRVINNFSGLMSKIK